MAAVRVRGGEVILCGKQRNVKMAESTYISDSARLESMES